MFTYKRKFRNEAASLRISELDHYRKATDMLTRSSASRSVRPGPAHDSLCADRAYQVLTIGAMLLVFATAWVF